MCKKQLSIGQPSKKVGQDKRLPLREGREANKNRRRENALPEHTKKVVSSRRFPFCCSSTSDGDWPPLYFDWRGENGELSFLSGNSQKRNKTKDKNSKPWKREKHGIKTLVTTLKGFPALIHFPFFPNVAKDPTTEARFSYCSKWILVVSNNSSGTKRRRTIGILYRV